MSDVSLKREADPLSVHQIIVDLIMEIIDSVMMRPTYENELQDCFDDLSSVVWTPEMREQIFNFPSDDSN